MSVERRADGTSPGVSSGMGMVSSRFSSVVDMDTIGETGGQVRLI